MNYEEWTGLREYTPEYKITDIRKKIFLDFLKTQPKGKMVLDIGFYPGDVCEKIREMGHLAHGLDVCKENIEKAKTKYPKNIYKYGDMEIKIPFEDNTFDVIWAGDIIEHVRDTIKVFSEFNRVLKKDGYLIVSTPYHGIIKMIVISLVDLKNHFHPEHKHVRFYTNKSLRMILKKYGFKILKEHYSGRIKLIENNMLFVAQKIKTLNFEEIPDMFR